MKKRSMKIVSCSVCGETDYSDYMDTIDGKLYCQYCAEKFESEIYDLDGKRR